MSTHPGLGPHDHPIDECAKTLTPLLKEGVIFFQKFTCAHCGSRQTMSEANKLFMVGGCEECGKDTDIAKRGCNYVLFKPMRNTPQARRELEDMIRQSGFIPPRYD